jgi:ribitol 2-dehydrogenase
VFRTIHAVLPHMVEKKSGDIVVTSSIAGVVPVCGSRSTRPRSTPCRRSCTRCGGRSRKDGIRVGAVLPGPVVTALARRLAEGQDGRGLANGSLMQPQEVADCVAFMLTRPRNVVIRDLTILPVSFDL